MKVLKSIDMFVEKMSSYGLVLGVFSMLLFSLLVILFRKIGVSALWLDPLNRHIVFLCTFLGGVLATGRGTHIGIDVIGKYLESKQAHGKIKMIKRIISFSSCLTLIWLAIVSVDLVKVEFEYPQIAFLGISTGYMMTIIPIGVSLIAFRFFVLFVTSFEKGEA
jgi:TRAP-type C4-dicarboxylate transport system permease small subunit